MMSLTFYLIKIIYNPSHFGILFGRKKNKNCKKVQNIGTKGNIAVKPSTMFLLEAYATQKTLTSRVPREIHEIGLAHHEDRIDKSLNPPCKL